ncbi:MAG: tyrosine-type recombinase/integrase [bacterium]
MRKTSKWWYGVWYENSNRHVKNLRIVIEGKRPADLNQASDRRFEASRAKAEAALSQLAGDPQDQKRAEALVQTLHQIKTGHRIGSVPLADMYKEWAALPGRITPTQGHLKWVESVLQRFTNYLTTAHPRIVEMGQVTAVAASDFMVAQAARGVSGRTYNEMLSTLKSVFKKLRRKAGLAENPFEDIETRQQDTRHRIPFSPEELKKIVDTSKTDPFCYPLIVTGVCTAMRRGDVCLLKWKDVDLQNRFITVRTNKTGSTVSIPIFPMLYDVLASQPQTSSYCFPDAAEIYEKNPDGINHRLKKVFRMAGFTDDENDDSTPPLTDTEKHDRGTAALVALTDKDHTAKVRETMKKVFDLYVNGGTVNTIAQELGIVKGSVSLYLKRVEEAVGFKVVRRSSVRKPQKKEEGEAKKDDEGKVKQVSYKVNQRGFHAFRATWVTLALTAGVAIELVRRVTGHATVEVVLGNYFQPGREDFRKALQDAMPALLTAGGAPSRDDQIREIVMNSTGKTWKQDHVKILALLPKTEI